MTRMTNVATRTFTNITGRNSVQHLEIRITTRKTAPITKTPYTSAKMTDLWKQGTMTKKLDEVIFSEAPAGEEWPGRTRYSLGS